MIQNRQKKRKEGLEFKIFNLNRSVTKYFILHGVLSISIRHTANFFGILHLGVSGVAFIMSLWPILSLLVGYLLFSSFPEYLRFKIHLKWLFLTAVILLIASLISIY